MKKNSPASIYPDNPCIFMTVRLAWRKTLAGKVVAGGASTLLDFFYLNPDLRLLLPFWSINHEIALLAQKNAWHQEWSLLLLKLKTVFKTFKIRTAAGLCIIWWNKTDLYAKRGLNDLCDDFRYCYACVYHIIIHFKQTFMLGMQQCLKIVKKMYK